MDVHPPKNGMYRYWSIAISAHHTNRDRNHNHRRMSKVTHQNPSAPPESLESALSSTNMETIQSSLVFHHNSPAMFQHINFIILGHNHRWSTSRKHKETIADFNWRFELTRCYCWWGLMLSDHLPLAKLMPSSKLWIETSGLVLKNALLNPNFKYVLVLVEYMVANTWLPTSTIWFLITAWFQIPALVGSDLADPIKHHKQ